MRQYYVKVHCCGARWLVHVPAVDRWTVIGDKKAIDATARRMIEDITGHAVDSFGIDLAAGRAIGSVAEFAPTGPALRRWHADSPTIE